LDSAALELDRAEIPHEPLRVDEFTGKRFFFLRDPDDLPIEIYEA
jgi:glyoxylase I family protein